MNNVPIFFSCDKNYIPFLAVTINSIKANANTKTNYDIYILTKDMPQELIADIKELEQANITINFVEIASLIKDVSDKLDEVRDYYTQAIFYRLFIPRIFPHLKRAIYIDCDIVLLKDIKELYTIDLEGKTLGVVVDDVALGNRDFIQYVEKAVGAYPNKYFNSGVLLMDLEKFRENKILEKFLDLLTKYHFLCVAPDQDYLNYLCRDLVKYLPKAWNRMPIDNGYEGELNLIHYNMFLKPWRYDVMYQEYFWKYAEGTKYYELLKAMKASYAEDFASIEKDQKGIERMVQMVHTIIDSKHNFVDCLDKVNE